MYNYFVVQTGHSKSKTLQSALDIILSCRKPLSWSMVQLKTPGDYGQKYEYELMKLLGILQQRLQYLLLQLVKIHGSKKGYTYSKIILCID